MLTADLWSLAIDVFLITRDVYGHLFEGKLEQAVQSMPPLFGNGAGERQ